MIKRLVARAFSSSFIRNTAMLASGSVAANLITLATLPMLSRLFPAGSFGLQALVTMGTMALAGLGTGYYDWAIPTPKTKKEATQLATLALIFATALALIVLVVLLLFGQTLLDALALGSLKAWAFALPPLGLALACYNIGNYWLLRAGRMANLTQIRFILPTTNALVSIMLGRMGIEAGLVIGYASGVLLSGIWSLALAVRHGLMFERHASRAFFRQLATTYREFPLYGSIPATAMLIAGQIPLLVITRAYALQQTGHYSVVRSLLYTGTMMVATATAQVILKQIAEARNNGEKPWPHFRQMLGLLALTGVTLGTVLYIASPVFFRFYLGPAWADSASIARLMSFALPGWLMGVALASAPIAMKKLKPIAAWQIGYGLAATYLFTLTHLPFMELVTRVILFEIIAYGIYVAVSVATVWKYGR